MSWLANPFPTDFLPVAATRQPDSVDGMAGEMECCASGGRRHTFANRLGPRVREGDGSK
jgi:hypothetical protein